MKKLLLLLLSVGAFASQSQSLSNEVIGSAGDYYTSASSALCWTAGEVMTETYITGANQLTQGFHQPRRSLVGIESENKDLSVSIYPNPTTGIINLIANGSVGELNIRITDLRGSVIYQTQNSAENLSSISIEHIERGMYFMHITDLDNNIEGTIKFQKM